MYSCFSLWNASCAYFPWLAEKQPCFSCYLVHPSFFFILLVFCLLSCFRPLDSSETYSGMRSSGGPDCGVWGRGGDGCWGGWDRPQEMWPQLTGQAVKADELKIRSRTRSDRVPCLRKQWGHLWVLIETIWSNLGGAWPFFSFMLIHSSNLLQSILPLGWRVLCRLG